MYYSFTFIACPLLLRMSVEEEREGEKENKKEQENDLIRNRENNI